MVLLPASAAPVLPVEFPRHLASRSAALIFKGQRGRVCGADLQDRPQREVAVQTGHADAHSHMAGPGYSHAQVYDFASPLHECMLDQLTLMDEAGVDTMLCMGIPTAIEGGPLGAAGGDPCNIGRSYYMPDHFRDNLKRPGTADLDALARVGQYYNTSVDWQLAHAWRLLPGQARQRLRLALTGLNLADPQGVHGIMRLKREHADVFHWAGEITRRKEVVDSQNRDYRPGRDGDGALHVYMDFLQRAGMGMTLHNDVSDVEQCLRTGSPGRSEYLPEMRRLLRAHPQNVLVWAHIGGLGKFSPPSRHHEADLMALLQEFPQLHIDLSWDVVAQHYSPHARPALNLTQAQRAAFDPWRDARRRQRRIRALAIVINTFGDRFLMGSDTLVSRQAGAISGSYGIYANQGQGPGTIGHGGERLGLFDHLAPTTLERVLRGNFERLYAQARSASLRYEAGPMLKDMAAIQQQALRHGRLPNRWPA